MLMASMEKIYCQNKKSNGKPCGFFLGDSGPNCQFRTAPCKSCNNKTEINKYSSSIDEVINFKFDSDTIVKK